MKKIEVNQQIKKIRIIIKQSRFSDILIFLFLVVVSIIFSRPLLSNRVLFTHDGTFHVSRIIGTQFSMEEGQFLPTITSKWMNNFGYSWNLFYPPLFAYIGVLVKPFFVTYTKTLYSIVFYLSIIACLSMYYLVLEITKRKKAALITSIIYISAPYRITNVFVRMALGEVITMSFLPVLFLGLYNLLKGNGKRHYLITVGAVVILLSHNISSVITLFIAIAFGLFNIKEVVKKDIIRKLLINCFFIVSITMFFFVPLFESKQYTNYAVFDSSFMTSNEEMHKQSIHLKQLFVDNFKYERAFSIDDEKDHTSEMNFSLGYPIIISLVMCPYVFYRLIREKRAINTQLYFIMMGCVCVYLTTFYFPWDKMPRAVTFLQVPYRFLTPAVFLLSVQAGMSISYIEDKMNLYHVFAAMILLIIYTYPYFINLSYDDLATEYPMLVDSTSFLACANFEYLPYEARKNFDDLCQRNNEVIKLKGEAKIVDYYKENVKMSFEIKDNSNEDLILELPYTNYIGYKIELNGQKINIEESPRGLIQISIPGGKNGQISVSYPGTNAMNITKTVSILSTVLFIVYVAIINTKDVLKNKKVEVQSNE